MHEILISVLASIYNSEEYIEQFMNSLFSNTFADKCEFIFCDDCSTDSTVAIAERIMESYSLRTMLIKNAENVGLPMNRNVLLDRASGDYVIFVDSDDWVEPDYIEKFYTKIRETGADIISCSFIKENPGGSSTYALQHLSSGSLDNIRDFVSHKISHCVWNKTIKMSLIKENGIRFPNIKNLKKCDDSYFMGDVFLAAESFAEIPEYLYHYRKDRPGSLSDSTKQDADGLLLPVKFSLYYEQKLKDAGIMGTAEAGEDSVPAAAKQYEEQLKAAFGFNRCFIRWKILMTENEVIRREYYRVFPGCGRYAASDSDPNWYKRFVFYNCDRGHLKLAELLVLLYKKLDKAGIHRNR
ncbi:MAG: glycosyltransferase family 2 protein [Eubacteriales bacterium]|nr:glycosyltransferase family 2 protein [Eubacteriales bacterium]